MNPQMKDGIPHCHDIEKREFKTEVTEAFPSYKFHNTPDYTTQNTLKDTAFSVHNKFEYNQPIQTELQEVCVLIV